MAAICHCICILQLEFNDYRMESKILRRVRYVVNILPSFSPYPSSSLPLTKTGKKGTARDNEQKKSKIMVAERSERRRRHSRLCSGTADIGTPTAQISCAVSRGAGRMRPSMKYQNDENASSFVPSGNDQLVGTSVPLVRKTPKSTTLFPKDELAPWMCQFPTSVAFVGMAYETAALVIMLSTRHPRIMLSIVVWTGFTSVAILPIPTNPVNPVNPV